MFINFSNFLLALFNTAYCLCRIFSGLFGGNYVWMETDSEESMEIECAFLAFHGTGVRLSVSTKTCFALMSYLFLM